MKLSIVIPVYNEVSVFEDFWSVFLDAPIQKCAGVKSVEVIIVDDGSKDGTTELIKAITTDCSVFADGTPLQITMEKNLKNRGKGFSVRRGIDMSTGDVLIIQDSDLEYSPSDYPTMLEPILSGYADAVFGSRFVGHPRRVLYFWHTVANRILTGISNMVMNINITDMETCYKAFRGELVRSFRLSSNRFGIEPELTARIAKSKVRLYEVPISYRGRTYEEGKKITFKDGIAALFHIIRYGYFDKEPFKPGLNQTLNALEDVGRFLYGPVVKRAIDKNFPRSPGQRLKILEIGSGIGTITNILAQYGTVTATDISEEYVQKLESRFSLNKRIDVHQWDASKPPPPEIEPNSYDIVVSFNVLEHIDDDDMALQTWRSMLRVGGQMVILVPHSMKYYTPIDKALGHFRRYSDTGLSGQLVKLNLSIQESFYCNAVGILGWVVRGRVFGKSDLPAGQLGLYVMIKKRIRLIEAWIEKYTGLSLIVVAKKGA